MSDYSISIVPRQSTFPEKENKAKEILDWLVSLDIVKPMLSDCILSENFGYPVSNGAKNVTNSPEHLPFGIKVNGLEIIKERQIFDTGQNGIGELICPNCQKDIIEEEDWDFLSAWNENNTNNIICPLCKVSANIHGFKFTPEWAFSDLGFTFWNWPSFKTLFIEEFIERLGSDINIVYTHI